MSGDDTRLGRAAPSRPGTATSRGSPFAEPIPSTVRERLDVRAAFPGIAATVSVTGGASNTGKTWLCETIIRGLAGLGRAVCALKVTRTHSGDCPRGVDTCHTCDSLSGDFRVITDRASLDVPRKDTGRYYAAGAHDVIWLVVSPRALPAGLNAALRQVPPGSTLVAEGNSFRDYASADVTLMALTRGGELKTSARVILDRIDAFVAHRHGSAFTTPPEGSRSECSVIAPAEAWQFARTKLGR